MCIFASFAKTNFRKHMKQVYLLIIALLFPVSMWADDVTLSHYSSRFLCGQMTLPSHYMISLRVVLMLPIKSQAQKTDVLYPLPPKHRMTGIR